MLDEGGGGGRGNGREQEEMTPRQFLILFISCVEDQKIYERRSQLKFVFLTRGPTRRIR